MDPLQFCKNIQDDTLTHNHDRLGCGVDVGNAFDGSCDIVMVCHTISHGNDVVHVARTLHQHHLSDI